MDEPTERNETPVEVTLKTDRMYRAKDSDSVAITVKAGVPTMVPTWVAESWGVLAAETAAAETETAAVAKPAERKTARPELVPGQETPTSAGPAKKGL